MRVLVDFGLSSTTGEGGGPAPHTPRGIFGQMKLKAVLVCSVGGASC